METTRNDLVSNYQMTEDIVRDAKWIIESAQKHAHSAVNLALVQRNWLLGYRIAEEEMKAESAC